MASKPLRINATTRADRHRTIRLVEEAISSSGGWLLDFSMFSNISICFNIEIKTGDIDRLLTALQDIELKPAVELPDIDDPDSTLGGTIQITFIHNEPDLRIDVPAVPG